MKGFVKISRYAGMREDLVQAGGGNSSFKISESRMAIKASGYHLADLNEDEGYSIVDPGVIRDFFMERTGFDGLTETDGRRILQDALIEGKRPSIETFLHAVSGKYTLHTHPIAVNALACRAGGMEVLKEMFPGSAVVPYATPGIELAKAYFRAFREKMEKTGIVFLKNHGLVVSGETSDDAIGMTERIVRTVENRLSMDMEAYHNVTKLWKHFPDRIVWRVTDMNVMRYFKEKGSIWEHAFCPDCVVFMGRKMFRLADVFSEEDIGGFAEAYGDPVVVSYKSGLYIIADNVKKAMEIQSVLSFSAQVMEQNDGYGCDFLSDEEQDFLLGWESEKYRKNMK